jgi:hypothetical protein
MLKSDDVPDGTFRTAVDTLLTCGAMTSISSVAALSKGHVFLRTA